jgi:hypothetical protein
MVFAESGASVHTVMVDGEIVVEAGRITKFDEAAILAEARPMLGSIRRRNARLYDLAQRVAQVFP